MVNLETYLDFSEIDGLSASNGLIRDLSTLARNAANRGVGIYCSFAQGRQQGLDTSELLDIAKLPLGEKTLAEAIHEIMGGGSKREDMYRYFLLSSACYVESPTSRFMGGTQVAGYSKELVTGDSQVTANWLQQDLETTEASLKNRFRDNMSPSALAEGTVSVVRFETDKEGTPKIVRPRKPLELTTAGMRLMPYQVLVSYVEQMVENLHKSYARIHYLKDSGQVRTIDTTLSYKLLKEVYSQNHVTQLLEYSEKLGEPNMKKRARGYITLPEVGLPETDSGVRAVNFFRILKIEYGIEPDLRFLTVNLPGVVTAFRGAAEMMDDVDVAMTIEALVSSGVIKESVWKKEDGSWKKNPSWDVLSEWVDSASNILGTEFVKSLHTFMLENESLFPGYSGEIKDTSQEAGNYQLGDTFGVVMGDLLSDD